MRGASGALALLVTVATPVAAATILEHHVDLEIDGGTIVERRRLLVELVDPGDPADWSEYPIRYGELVELVECRAELLDSTGVLVERVPKKKFRKEPATGSSLHSSDFVKVIPFPTLDVGRRLLIEFTRRHRPVFPAFRMILADDDDQRSLRVRVRGGDRLRWQLQAADDVVTTSEADGVLVIEGRDIPGVAPIDHAPDAYSWLPMLRLSWYDDSTWRGVGLWYDDLLADLPGASPAVQRIALDLAGALDDNRDKLAALAGYVKRTVRYEAVQIGRGGWIPSAAGEVVERGWGDCKDKAELLVELLDEVGIPAHLVLIRNGNDGRIEANFPITNGFNHAVVAVPAEAAGALDDDPVVEGLLFIDATVDRGGPLWLSPYIQGQWALVVDGDNSRLVRIPVLAGDERRRLHVDGDIGTDGALSATVALRLMGARAIRWLRDLDSEDPARIDEDIRRYLQIVIPGAQAADVGWRELEGAVPAIHMQAKITVPGFVTGSPGRRRLRPGLLSALPEPRELDDRSAPVVLFHGNHRTTWRLRLPDEWCPLVEVDDTLSNSVGAFRVQAATDVDGSIAVERTTTLHRWWFGPESFDDLRELCIAENRGNRRSLKLRCPSP